MKNVALSFAIVWMLVSLVAILIHSPELQFASLICSVVNLVGFMVMVHNETS